MNRVLILCLLILSLFHITLENQCSEYGFTPNLMCTTCDKMSKYINDEGFQVNLVHILT